MHRGLQQPWKACGNDGSINRTSKTLGYIKTPSMQLNCLPQTPDRRALSAALLKLLVNDLAIHGTNLVYRLSSVSRSTQNQIATVCMIHVEVHVHASCMSTL